MSLKTSSVRRSTALYGYSCDGEHLHPRHKALLFRELRAKAEQKLIFWITEMKKLETAVLICCMKDRSIV